MWAHPAAEPALERQRRDRAKFGEQGVIGAVFEDRVETYRRKAEECRQRAAQSAYEADKAAWLQMAEEWLRLAASVARAPR